MPDKIVYEKHQVSPFGECLVVLGIQGSKAACAGQFNARRNLSIGYYKLEV